MYCVLCLISCCSHCWFWLVLVVVCCVLLCVGVDDVAFVDVVVSCVSCSYLCRLLLLLLVLLLLVCCVLCVVVRSFGCLFVCRVFV